MNVEIVTHAKESRSASQYPSPVRGSVQVLLEGKIKIWLRVLESKAGHIYVKFTDVKIHDGWMPVMEYVGRDLAKEIGTQLKDELVRIFSV